MINKLLFLTYIITIIGVIVSCHIGELVRELLYKQKQKDFFSLLSVSTDSHAELPCDSKEIHPESYPRSDLCDEKWNDIQNDI